MATFTEIYLLASDLTFQQRVKVAMMSTAFNIVGEAIGTMTLSQTNKRQVLGTNILNGGGNILQWSLAVANNAAISNAFATALAVPDTTVPEAAAVVPDGDIQFTVNSVWDDMAGVTSEDLV